MSGDLATIPILYCPKCRLNRGAGRNGNDGMQEALKRGGLNGTTEIHISEVDELQRPIIGKSPAIRQAIDFAKKVASSKATVLLLGESGTGKEIFARAIHEWSDRKSAPFVAINCVGLSKELLESELFGHEKGSFTGAHELKRGKMELAHGGTVFLDEVGDISLELQAKLLRFLQEREFVRVGGTNLITVNVRIIGATNRNLDHAVQTGGFREDLFHRLNVVPIVLPPLRERREDVPGLASHFLQIYSSEAQRYFAAISEEAMEKLLAYEWPGNVRELTNVIERAVVLGVDPRIEARDLPLRVLNGRPNPELENLSYHEATRTFKKDFISRALAARSGNRAAAAKMLGLRRTSLLRLMKSLAIA